MWAEDCPSPPSLNPGSAPSYGEPYIGEATKNSSGTAKKTGKKERRG